MINLLLRLIGLRPWATYNGSSAEKLVAKDVAAMIAAKDNEAVAVSKYALLDTTFVRRVIVRDLVEKAHFIREKIIAYRVSFDVYGALEALAFHRNECLGRHRMRQGHLTIMGYPVHADAAMQDDRYGVDLENGASFVYDMPTTT